MHRIKQGKEYYVFPGGKIEPGETHEQTLKREMKEEINADIEITDFFAEHSNFELHDHNYFYLCKHTGGELKLGDGPEFKQNSLDNFYEIITLPISELSNYPLYPTAIKELVIEKL
jgi:mutator protein MutT